MASATTTDTSLYPTIKPATRDDVPDILALIHELASYENATSFVAATEQSLARTLTFAPSGNAAPTNTGYARAVILRTPAGGGDGGKKVAGFALYFNNYSTWRAAPGIYLEDLFVRPQYRGKGWGTLLMRFLAAEVLRCDGGRLEWSCLKWNESSLRFYESLGAQQMSGWVGLRVEGAALMNLATGKFKGKEPGGDKKEG